MTRHTRRRTGFTLIELLVAVSLAIVVVGLAVAVSNSAMFESYKVVGAGDRLSQYMLIAKSRAIRDKAPRGIRILQDEAGRNSVVQYTEAPEAWTPAAVPAAGQLPSQVVMIYPQDPTPAGYPSRRILVALNPNDAASFISDVQKDDFLSIPQIGWTGKIVATPVASTLANFTSPNYTVFELVFSDKSTLPHLGAGFSIAPNGTISLTGFGVFRAARPLLGEPTVQLPSGMAVDLSNSLNPLDANSGLDLLFGPSGEVINSNFGIRAFLLRDFNRTPTGTGLLDQTWVDGAGQMVLVCVYTRTGSIGTQPPAPPGSGDPYKFAKDGINTGL